MGFKIKKKPERKLVAFRVPVELVRELRAISKKEGVSLTKLVDLLTYCVEDYHKSK